MTDTLTLLQQALMQLNPSDLAIRDDSALHRGHLGNNGGGHYHIKITSAAFEGLSLIARHRLIYQAADSLMGGMIHALSIEANSPSEKR